MRLIVELEISVCSSNSSNDIAFLRCRISATKRLFAPIGKNRSRVEHLKQRFPLNRKISLLIANTPPIYLL